MTVFTSVLKKVIGLQVGEVISGGSNGSILLLTFGDEKPVCTILISCVWRLQMSNTVLAGWNDSPDPEHGNLTIQTKLLEKDYVHCIEVSEFYDLSITFKSEKRLRVFCDITPQAETDEDENWYMADLHANKCYLVNRELKIVERMYK